MIKAHQRKIREAEAHKNPRPPMSLAELQNSIVRECTRREAEAIILKYEWLGTLKQFTVGYALETPSGELAGVVCFVKAAGTFAHHFFEKSDQKQKAKSKLPAFLLRAAYLHRGACVHWAHEHAASFLISRACRYAYQEYGWQVFYAYSDPRAGEVGTIYQACNWFYLGYKFRGVGATRKEWHYDGSDGIHPPQKFSTKALRGRLPRRVCDCGGCKPRDKQGQWPFIGKLKDATSIKALHDVAGWTSQTVQDKHKYIHFEGTRAERKLAMKTLRYQIQNYPKRITAPARCASCP
jgi:hypothetical protein